MTAENQIREAFLAALMLTGTAEAAEQAVTDAIGNSECDGALDELPVATAKRAMQLRDRGLPQAELPTNLPPELQRLFSLSTLGRDCFVLRMLMGLTPEVISGILNLDRDEVDEALCRALSHLPHLAVHKSAPANAVEHAAEGGKANRLHP